MQDDLRVWLNARTLPEGLVYVPAFLAEVEERGVLAVLAVLATLELQPYVLHDTPSRRLVRSFGLARVAGAYDAGPAAPIPAELEWLRDRCAGLMGREPAELAELLVSRYPSAREESRSNWPIGAENCSAALAG